MLSPEATATVRATLPVIGAAIDDIAARFYDTMFADNPELLRNLFNRGNQANGEQRAALAGSIAAYASSLVNGAGVPHAMLARIANKHASLGVTSDQYTVVQRYLFGAIAHVLGDAATPDVVRAWDEVYWLMAGTLIAMEAVMYSESEQGWLPATVVDRRQEAPDTVSFTLRPPSPGAFRPGQYISVAVPLADGARQIRQYSLSSAPGRDHWRITVKRVSGGGPDGEVSSMLHASVRPGDVLSVSAPFGDLVLPPGDGPLLLASAGIGVTPILSMLGHLAATGSTRRVVVVHADRAPAHHAHREELHDLVAALPGATLHRWYEDTDGCSCACAEPALGERVEAAVPAAGGSTGRASAQVVPVRVGRADLSEIELPEGLTACLCGPVPFMREARAQLIARGVPASDIHYEVFGPDLWLGRD
ncbi:globin domain-containing protein [Sphaerisporangium melleum]|uniref:globin domain-containing protein n=1 Tax=Sphaerisporangium melleum TaxID=321316 RepID=UPI0016664BB6|nr:globin domain-containing protein [Sphaerisporangium melleum]